MSDNTTLNTGSGGDTIRDKDRSGVKTQIVGLDLAPGGSETLMNGSMPVTGTFWQSTQPVSIAASVAVTGTFWQTTQPISVSSLPLPSGASTSAKQPALGTAGSASTDVITIQGITSMTPLIVVGAGTAGSASGGVVTVQGVASMTPLLVTASIASAQTLANVTTVGTITNNVNVVGAIVAAATGAWTSSTTLNAAISISCGGYSTAVFQVIQTDSGSAVITAGIATFEVSVDNTNWYAISAYNIGASSSSSTVAFSGNPAPMTINVAGWNYIRARLSTVITQGAGSGTATANVSLTANHTPSPVVNIGNNITATITGTPNVSVTNNPVLGAGTNLMGKVGIDQTTPGTTNGIALAPDTASALSTARVAAASGTNATVVKNSPGNLYGWYLYNNTSSVRVIHFYATASTPTAGSGTPFFTLALPPNGGANVFWAIGIPFATGIAYTITTGVSDTNTGSCSADDVHGILLYL